jgi:hypothetical protein
MASTFNQMMPEHFPGARDPSKRPYTGDRIAVSSMAEAIFTRNAALRSALTFILQLLQAVSDASRLLPGCSRFTPLV